MGVGTQDLESGKRLKIDISASRVEYFIKVSTALLNDFARITGHDSAHKLFVNFFYTSTSEILDHTKIQHGR